MFGAPVGLICLQLLDVRSLFQHFTETGHMPTLPVTRKYFGVRALNTDQHVLALPPDELSESHKNVRGMASGAAQLAVKKAREQATRRAHTIRAMRRTALDWAMAITKQRQYSMFYVGWRQLVLHPPHLSICTRPHIP